MVKPQKLDSLIFKILNILIFLFFARLSLDIPVPGIDVNLFIQNQATKQPSNVPFFLANPSFLALGSIGIIPYYNSVFFVQYLNLITKFVKSGEEAETINKIITIVTVVVAFIYSVIYSNSTIRPLTFNWNSNLAFVTVISLTTGSLLFLFFSTQITRLKLGNGASMLFALSIIENLGPVSVETSQNLGGNSNFFELILINVVSLIIALLIILFQESYIEVKLLPVNKLDQSFESLKLENVKRQDFFKNKSYIPLKFAQSGITPIIYSGGISTALFYPLKNFFDSFVGLGTSEQVTELVKLILFFVFLFLNLSFSISLGIINSNPREISRSLIKLGYIIPETKPGNETKLYLENRIRRLSYLGGFFFSSLIGICFLLSEFLGVQNFKFVTSEIILLSVAADVLSKWKAVSLLDNYKNQFNLSET